MIKKQKNRKTIFGPIELLKIQNKNVSYDGPKKKSDFFSLKFALIKIKDKFLI